MSCVRFATALCPYYDWLAIISRNVGYNEVVAAASTPCNLRGRQMVVDQSPTDSLVADRLIGHRSPTTY